MLSNPLFSILIANYNNGRYLMDAINSVYKQTYTNWEIVLVDDGSTDNFVDIYQQLENDTRIHVYFNDTNRGCGYTKRRCVELAQGELCGFLDPDDALLPKACELMVDVHIKNPNIAIVYSKAYLCDTKFNIIGHIILPDFSAKKKYFDNRESGSMCFSSFKKCFYNKTDGINAELKAGVDQDLYFRVEEVGDIYILDEFTYNYVIEGHSEAISTNFSNYARLWYWNLKARQDACRRRGISEDILVMDFSHILDNYARQLFAERNGDLVENLYKEKIQQAIEANELKIRNSKAYCLGKFLLKPFDFAKRILSGIGCHRQE